MTKIKDIDLLGYCDICGQGNGVMKLYELKSSNSDNQTSTGIQRLCISHYQQKKENNSKLNSVIKANYKDKLYSAMDAIFPNKRRP